MKRLHPPSLKLWRDKQAHRNVFSEDVKKSLRLLSEERLSPREVKTCVFVIFLPGLRAKKMGWLVAFLPLALIVESSNHFYANTINCVKVTLTTFPLKIWCS